MTSTSKTLSLPFFWITFTTTIAVAFGRFLHPATFTQNIFYILIITNAILLIKLLLSTPKN